MPLEQGRQLLLKITDRTPDPGRRRVSQRRRTFYVSCLVPSAGSDTFAAAAAQLLGYARVFTADQAPELQLDELRAAGCERIWTDHATGTRADRPQLGRLLEHMREGDTLVVWRLDRLARSLSDLLGDDTFGSLALNDLAEHASLDSHGDHCGRPLVQRRPGGLGHDQPVRARRNSAG